jgi:hypothetical protein
MSEVNHFSPIKLDDTEHTVTFSDGRFKHFLARPSAEMILERDAKMKHEIPLDKFGSIIEDDGSEQDAIDAECYQKIKLREPEGYKSVIPVIHQARAFRALYTRYFEVPEDADIFADLVPVHEIYGDLENPSNIVVHLLRQPDEKEFRKMLVAMNRRERKPDKRGREKIVVPSYLRKAMEFYRAHFDSIKNAMLNNESYNSEKRTEFIDNIDPLIQRMVVKTLIEAIDEASRD